jgi:FMN phosphatase YigB (HAD superfamily)
MKPQTFDPSVVTTVFFDLFGTLVDIEGNVPEAELKEYAAHIKKKPWTPFRPPISWRTLKLFPDVEPGMAELFRLLDQRAVLSNCPYVAAQVLTFPITWSLTGIIQLAAARVFKPDPKAYRVGCDVLDVSPEECLMVTANENFGDLAASRLIGMQAVLIRGDSDIPDLLALAERLRT